MGLATPGGGAYGNRTGMGVSLAVWRIGALILGLVAAWWLANQIAGGSIVYAVLFAAALGGLLLLLYPPVLVSMALLLQALPLTTPFFPLQLNFHYLACLALIVFLVLWVVSRRSLWRIESTHVVALLLCTLLVALMFARGFGLRAAGAGQVGGMRYIHVFATTGLLLAATVFPLPPGRWRWLIPGMAAGAGLLFLAEILVTRGIFVQVISTVLRLNPWADDLVEAIRIANPLTDIQLGRLANGQQFALWMVVAVLCVWGPRRLLDLPGLLAVPFLVLAGGAAAVSGYRIAFLRMAMTFCFSLWLDRGFTPRRIFVLGSLGLLLVGGAYVAAPHLPAQAQRAISFLPGVDISYLAKTSADDTLTWRLAVWETAFAEAPRYLLLGKGWTYDQAQFTYGRLTPIDWALLNLTYHNGPLAILITLGVPGVLIIIALHTVAVRRHFWMQGQPWRDPYLRRAHGVFLGLLLSEVAVFWVVYGDAYLSLPQVLVLLAFVEGLRASDALAPPPAEEAAPPSTVAPSPAPAAPSA